MKDKLTEREKKWEKAVGEGERQKKKRKTERRKMGRQLSEERKSRRGNK